MRIIFFSHPEFLNHQSMPRFTSMLAEGMQKRGHQIEVLSPSPGFYNLPVPKTLKKWMGYIDQYVAFPQKVKKLLKSVPANALFVFTDHALGPWVPLVANYPHVIHCHDFLAQLSAAGEIPQNPTSATGKIYQQYIRDGYRKGKNFISISKKTQKDLNFFLHNTPAISEIVYNGVNSKFVPGDYQQARVVLSEKTGLNLKDGYLMHVGGNQWYKNRVGILKLYEGWRKKFNMAIPLVFIGEEPSVELDALYQSSEFKSGIYFLTNINDLQLIQFYNGASALLFPSLAEGFGWPIAEAMASGCPVITTNVAPMTEVGGEAAFYIPSMPMQESEMPEWINVATNEINKVVALQPAERSKTLSKGFDNVKRFDVEQALNQIEAIYKRIAEVK